MKTFDIERVVVSAIATANQSYKVKMTAETMASAIKECKLPDKWKFHIYDFFADNPPRTILGFCKYYGITLEELQKFYEKFIKPDGYRNIYLESVWEF